jgi:predicted DNA binding CopG/RHH family protein
MANKKPRKTTSKKIIQKSTSRDLIQESQEDVTEMIQFLKNVQFMSHPKAQSPSKLISIKVPELLLETFRFKAQSRGIPYQTMIKRLMHQWIFAAGPD